MQPKAARASSKVRASDPHATIIDQPAFLVGLGVTAASESGHAPMVALIGLQVKPLGLVGLRGSWAPSWVTYGSQITRPTGFKVRGVKRAPPARLTLRLQPSGTPAMRIPSKMRSLPAR